MASPELIKTFSTGQDFIKVSTQMACCLYNFSADSCLSLSSNHCDYILNQTKSELFLYTMTPRFIFYCAFKVGPASGISLETSSTECQEGNCRTEGKVLHDCIPDAPHYKIGD